MTIKSALKELCKNMTGIKSEGRTIAAIIKDISDNYPNKVPVLESISITTPPTKTTYVEGDTFSTTGMVVKANYEDGTSETITNYTYFPTGQLTVSDREIIISYKGKTAKQLITIDALAVVSIEVTTPPTGTIYRVGDLFDPNGMVVTATYNNGTTKEITDYTYSPTGPLTINDTIIAISYEGYTATQSITITE